MNKKILISLIVLLAAINIYWFWPGNLYFLNDDLLHIPLTANGRFFQTNSVRPLHELLVRLDLLMWSKNAAGFHATAILLHFIVCLQVYHLCKAIQLHWLKVNDNGAALLSVVLFLAYPQSSESIAWILGRTPVLSAIFFLGMLQLFFRETVGAVHCVLGCLLFTATLFTYEQSILFPLCLLWLALLETDKTTKRRKTVFVLSLFLSAGIYLVLRRIITNQLVGNYEGGNLISLNVAVLAANFFRLVTRLWLNPAAVKTYLAMVSILMAITGFIAIALKPRFVYRKKFVFFSGAILLLLLPVVSLGVAVTSYELGRYLYLPAIFLVIALALFGMPFYMQTSRRKLTTICTSLLLAYWLFGKWQAAKHYNHASAYAAGVNNSIHQHFMQSTATYYIDTLQLSVDGLPVFRLGFKTGVNWLYNNVDTTKVVVLHRYDGAVTTPIEK